jgi:hypothetical protein
LPDHHAASPFNHFITPIPDELLRVTVGLGLRRARLQAVYPVLRGKDAETDRFPKKRGYVSLTSSVRRNRMHSTW